ncbi:hypothetical protein BH11ACT3_BH11ACT3_18180 [soil metagenome]
MGFLPFPADDEMSPDAATAREAFLAEHPGPLSNLDRTLLGSKVVWHSYIAWFELHDEIAPYVGERAVSLFSLAISEGYGAPYPVAFFRKALADAGDDPEAPQVTEAEQLLIDWGRALGAGPATVDPALAARVEETFQPQLRLALTAFAGFMVATALVTVVGQIPFD